VNHCLGVVDYWVGHLVAGRPVDRDRPAEFTASGPVRNLADRIEATKVQLRRDVAAAVPADPLRSVPADRCSAGAGRTSPKGQGRTNR